MVGFSCSWSYPEVPGSGPPSDSRGNFPLGWRSALLLCADTFILPVSVPPDTSKDSSHTGWDSIRPPFTELPRKRLSRAHLCLHLGGESLQSKNPERRMHSVYMLPRLATQGCWGLPLSRAVSELKFSF